MQVVLILHNVRSTHNVGSIFRTADAAGVQKIFLTGYTPTPTDRFNRQRSDIAKVALGAEHSVLWQYAKQLKPVVQKFKKEGFLILALEQDLKSISLFDHKNLKSILHGHSKIGLIVGNEVSGISPTARALADHIIEIPMRGKKESLNVAVVAGIALFTLTKDF